MSACGSSAVWLLPLDMSWPPEIDVIEVLGHEPRKVYQTAHFNEPATPGGQKKSAYVITEAFDTSAGFHTNGVHWTKETMAFYIDGRETKRFPTPAQMHRPMYMIVNLAVGGGRPGDPDATTAFPAELRVRSVRAWR
jgi:beta-glucanase (GH16 family)